MLRKTLTLVMAWFIVALAATFAAGCSAGAAEARQDIARGHLELRSYGLPMASNQTYVQLLRDRLGVEDNRVAGCIVTQELVDETDAYNKVMVAEIERRFGAGILERLRDEAAATYATTNEAANRR
jgi:hypothetical protein